MTINRRKHLIFGILLTVSSSIFTVSLAASNDPQPLPPQVNYQLVNTTDFPFTYALDTYTSPDLCGNSVHHAKTDAVTYTVAPRATQTLSIPTQSANCFVTTVRISTVCNFSEETGAYYLTYNWIGYMQKENDWEIYRIDTLLNWLTLDSPNPNTINLKVTCG